MAEQTNTLLAKTSSDSLYLLGDATGFSVNGNEVKFQDKAGTIAYTSDCLASVGDGLQVDGSNKVSAKVKDGEKVITVSSDGFATTLSLEWAKAESKILLRGVGDEVVSEIDAKDFVKDGMLKSVELSSDGGKEYLVFTWNTDAGDTTLPVDVTKFVDVYTASDGVKLDANNNFSIDWDQVAKKSALSDYLTVSAAASTYETSSHAASTYNTKADASAFETKVASTYATTGSLDKFKTEVASTYETSSHAASTYATVDTLTGNYLKTSEASAKYETITNVNTFKTEVASTYLTKSDAASTYETSAHADGTFATKTALEAVTKALSGETLTWSDVTLNKVYDLVKQMAKTLGATIS